MERTQEEIDKYIEATSKNFTTHSLKVIMLGIVITIVLLFGNFVYENVALLFSLKTFSLEALETILIITNLTVFILVILLVFYGFRTLRNN